MAVTINAVQQAAWVQHVAVINALRDEYRNMLGKAQTQAHKDRIHAAYRIGVSAANAAYAHIVETSDAMILTDALPILV